MPTIIDTLVTDRSAVDVARAKILETKGYSALSAAEKAEWDSAINGAYDYIDMNRVGEAVAYLAEILNGYGYAVNVAPKTDWTLGYEPSSEKLTQYLAAINTIKTAFYGTTELPADMDGLTVAEANAIETLLIEIDTYINDMVAAFRYCGELVCGEEYA
jgi:hypothetical protein